MDPGLRIHRLSQSGRVRALPDPHGPGPALPGPQHRSRHRDRHPHLDLWRGFLALGLASLCRSLQAPPTHCWRQNGGICHRFHLNGRVLSFDVPRQFIRGFGFCLHRQKLLGRSLGDGWCWIVSAYHGTGNNYNLYCPKNLNCLGYT